MFDRSQRDALRVLADAAAAAAVAALVACGGGGGTDPNGNPDDDPAVTPAPAPPPPASAPPAAPGDADRGRVLYGVNCSGCHGALPDSRAASGAGSGPSITLAITLVRQMGPLRTAIGEQEARDIAAWLLDPR